LQTLSGRSFTIEGVTAHGNTDVEILRDALSLADVGEAEWRPRLTEIRTRMCSFVETREDGLCATALTCVPEVLAHLGTKAQLWVFVTGNLREIGRIKLQRAGLLDYLRRRHMGIFNRPIR
jgi:phosphoglycolate phosphatase